MTPKLKVIASKELLEFGKPKFATPGSAAIDLRAMLNGEHTDPANCENLVQLMDDDERWHIKSVDIAPGKVVKIDTGLRIWVNDPAYVGLLIPRSSMGKRDLTLANTVGAIDSDYQGPLVMLLRNVGSNVVTIENGERLIQFMLTRVDQFDLDFVSDFETNTIRGSGGFGSTGTVE